MTDYFRLVIVGHDLEAKCAIANAFLKQKFAFKQLTCRRNVAKPFGGKGTLSGMKYVIVLTPNLNTPAWTNEKSKIRKAYMNKAFLYVKDYGKVYVNHEESIQKIKNEFRGVKVHSIDYTVNKSIANSFYQGMSFDQKVEMAKTLLVDINKEQLTTLKMPYKGSEDVPGRRRDGNKHGGELQADDQPEPVPESNNTRSDPDNQGTTLSNLAEATTANTYKIELPKELGEKDWKDFADTLRRGRAKSNHVRVNVVGNQNAGKTTLVKLLQNMNVKCPDRLQPPTEALDITEITSRCTEIDGKKHWETDVAGYEDELNVQRMTEAMKNAIKITSESETFEDTDSVEQDTIYSSCAPEETQFFDEPDSHPFFNISKQKSRDQYLKKIIGRRNNVQAPEYMYISYWDFAGQSTYYSAHQAFISNSAVYILVVDLSLDLNRQLTDSLEFRSQFVHKSSAAESILFWISSIKAFTTDAEGGTSPVMIVGTHIDKLKTVKPTDRPLQEKVKEKFDQILEILRMSDIECIAIDNTCPDIEDLQAIRNRILELGLGVIDEKIPAQWIDLERRIEKQKAIGKSAITFDELKVLDEAMDMPIKDNDRLEAFLGHQHCRGRLIHFPHKDLKDFILLQPDALAIFLNALMRSPNKAQQEKLMDVTKVFNRNGIINQMYINEVFRYNKVPGFDQCTQTLVSMLVYLSIIHPYQSDHRETNYLLPCLLPDKADENVAKPLELRVFQIEFPSDYMPSTFFYVLLSSLLKEWKPVERRLGEPELYNRYACFCLHNETQQMGVYWKNARIIIDVRNFSKKRKLAEIDLCKIMDIFKKHIANIFRIYRHTATNYEFKIQCLKHEGQFVSLSKLRKHGEAMCYAESGHHSVDMEEVLSNSQRDEKHPTLERKLTDRDLGRIAMHLTTEDATCLATRIRLHTGNVEADAAAVSTNDQNYRRFIVLKKWHDYNCSALVCDLLELITETGDYETHALIKRLTAYPTKNNYKIPDEKLDRAPEDNADIKAARDCLGNKYLFLALELGQTYQLIEQIRHDERYLKDRVYQILMAWRKENPAESTLRLLLDTMDFLGLDSRPIQSRISDK